MAESAYPVGHPGHPAYKGEPWVNPANVSEQAYPPGMPGARGENVSAIDTPDGLRAHLNKRENNLVDLAVMGSLPPLTDPDTGKTVELTPEQLAHVYTVRNTLRNEALAAEVTDRFKLDPKTETPASPVRKLSDDEIALGYLMGLGYSPDKAKTILDKYGVPDAVADKLEHARR